MPALLRLARSLQWPPSLLLPLAHSLLNRTQLRHPIRAGVIIRAPGVAEMIIPSTAFNEIHHHD